MKIQPIYIIIALAAVVLYFMTRKPASAAGSGPPPTNAPTVLPPALVEEVLNKNAAPGMKARPGLGNPIRPTTRTVRVVQTDLASR